MSESGSLCIITGSRGPAGCADVQCWIQLVSQLVPCVLLLAVEVLLWCVAAAVLDSANV